MISANALLLVLFLALLGCANEPVTRVAAESDNILSWDRPLAYESGSPLPVTDIIDYTIYYGDGLLTIRDQYITAPGDALSINLNLLDATLVESFTVTRIGMTTNTIYGSSDLSETILYYRQ